MNKTHRLMVAGIGAMTPAFIATDQLQARAAEGAAIGLAQSGRPAIALDQEALKSALLALSPTEKLRIAGDRIRLAAKAKVSTQSSVRGVPRLPSPARTRFRYRTVAALTRCAHGRRGKHASRRGAPRPSSPRIRSRRARMWA